MTPRRIAAPAALVASLLAASGCGGGSSGDAGTKTVVRTSTVEVVKPLDDAKATGSHAVSTFDAHRIYARESPGVVTVISTGLAGAGGNEAGLGSGFVVNGDGEIATNAHVVTSGEGAAIRRAKEVYVRFPDENQVPARIVGYDPFSDVALLRVDPKGLSLRPLPLGSTNDVQVGDPVAAIGSPFGEEQSLSVGVVSAKNRAIDSLTGFQTSGAIQTDAAINHGNSGGPLLDAQGAVLGINSQIRTDSGDGTGVGFAVPVDVVKRSLAQLRRSGRVHYAYLGVATRAIYPQLAQRFHLPVTKGVWVQQVTHGGPADHAGIKAGTHTETFQQQRWVTGGDIITAVDGRPVTQDDDLSVLLSTKRPGQTVTITLYRGNAKKNVRVKLGDRPLSAPSRG